MAGTLYLVATPIGNLEDLTYRAVRTLGEVDFVAAEDTRVSGKLLHYLEISKPLVSYHEHNKTARAGAGRAYIGGRELRTGDGCRHAGNQRSGRRFGKFVP